MKYTARNIIKAVGTLAILGIVFAGTATPSSAQGFYFSAPGFSFGVGTPWYGYYGSPYSYGPYAYTYPYHHYWRHRHWHHHH